jgi:RecA-family ATPase
MIERKIIIGLITSTEFCKRIRDIWNQQLIESVTAKRLAQWIWEYFDKYNKAPGKDLEIIFYTKLKETKVPKDIAEEIEQEILPGLSEEYTKEGVDLDPLIEESEKYLNSQHIKFHTTAVETLLTEGKLEEATKLMEAFKPLSTLVKLDKYILSTEKIRDQKHQIPRTFMKPWLKEGQGTIIYGPAGVGKSLLTILVAYLLGLPEDKDCEDIGEWQVKHSTGCLYIDGELGELEMEERIRAYEWLGKQSNKRRMQVLSVPDYQLKTEDIFFLSNRKNQLQIIKWLKEHNDYKLVILDSASTLFGLDDENSNSEWNNKMNPLLRDLRALGVSYIILHHAGKDNKKGLRGASAMSAMVHNTFRLVNHSDVDMDKGEAYFTIIKDKKRQKGYTFKNFSLHFYQSEDEKETHWEVTKND